MPHIDPVTNKNKQEWIEWLENQLDKTEDHKFKRTDVNRVFLTKRDDVDVATFLMQKFLATIKNIK